MIKFLIFGLMRVSENLLKWAIRFYPPLFFQRVWVVKFDKGFRGVEVKIRKSFWNRNYNNSIFWGTIFAAADAFYPVIFFKDLSLKWYNLRAWSKSVNIKYNKPSFTDLSYKIYIDDAELAEAEEILNTVGKYTKECTPLLEIYDKNGVNVASALNEVYMRKFRFY